MRRHPRRGQALRPAAFALAVLLGACALIEPPAPRSNIRDRIVDEATAQVDRPYRYGGADPLGFDNGGLVQYVFGRVGMRASRIPAELRASGRRVPYADMDRGDLVFHELEQGDRRELHVGIFIGRERMVHIRNGGRVEVDVIGSPYWRRRHVDSISLLPAARRR